MIATGSELALEPYSARFEPAWNAFVEASKNGVFLFDRRYMDYHADRFQDASVLVRRGDVVTALFPASIRDGVVTSHGGLTFGGVVSDRSMRAAAMVDLVEALLEHYRQQGATRLIYKPVPHIYHSIPAEEDLYALFRVGARLVRRDVSSTIRLADRPGYSKGRAHCVKMAARGALRIGESTEFAAFMRLEAAHLERKFGVAPVHTPDEMCLLASRFPRNIRLFGAHAGDELVAGVLVYVSRQVAHAQYIASNERGRELCALDGIIDHLLRDVFTAHRYFDFGISTEQQGHYLNVGLIGNKETYGARATVQDFYEIELA